MSKMFTLASPIVGGEARAALCMDGEYILLPDALHARYPTVKAILEDWSTAFPALKDFANGGAADAKRIAAKDVQLDVPIRFPNKVVAAGANYKDHLEEMGLPIVKFEPIPYYLMAPTTCLVGPGRTVRKPKMTEQFDWEIELVIVIGTRMTEADMETAKRGIVGYTVGIDLSARDLAKGGPPPFEIDFVRGKGQDTMAPIGPAILPAEFVPDVRDLDMKLAVNGELMQDSSTTHMIRELEEIVSDLSHFITLEPGDLIFTGTPTGVGAHRGIFLKSGDKISARIGEIGSLDVEIM